MPNLGSPRKITNFNLLLLLEQLKLSYFQYLLKPEPAKQSLNVDTWRTIPFKFSIIKQLSQNQNHFKSNWNRFIKAPKLFQQIIQPNQIKVLMQDYQSFSKLNHIFYMWININENRWCDCHLNYSDDSFLYSELIFPFGCAFEFC